MKVFHIDDGTEYGYDLTEDGRSITYYLRMDMFGDGRSIAVTFPGMYPVLIRSFKEVKALATQDRNKPLLKKQSI